MLTFSDNPPMLSPGTACLAGLTGRWWVAHTRSRFEKAFAWDLLQRRIGYFLPLMERVRFSGGRRRKVLAPLFAGYVFFCGRPEDRLAAMQTNRLCRTLEVADQEKLVSELTALERCLLGKARLDPYPRLAAGRRCRVRSGPFRGLEGIIIRRDGRTSLVLQVSVLGRGAAMDISCDLVEPVD